MKIKQITPDSNNFLKILSSIALMPKKLYYLGTLPEKRQPTVAIVGTRKPSAYGREVTERLAEELAGYGIIIVSGMALGVDAIAHRAALHASGITIAVQGNGLANLYPATNRQLGTDIINSGGAIISEYAPEVTARGHQFLERNRIVSGLSDAVIITEAAARSGTLNTAMHALEQGKEVFVVPGNITSALSVGCNTLIKQGATPITCAQDIVEIIAPELLKKQSSLPIGNTAEETTILQLLQAGIRDGDELQKKSSIDVQIFTQAMTMLELNGAIRSLGNNQWTVR